MKIEKCGKLNIYRVYMVIARKCLQGEVEFALIFIPKNRLMIYVDCYHIVVSLDERHLNFTLKTNVRGEFLIQLKL